MAKPKRRVVQVDPELVRQFEELKRKMAEDDIRLAAALARAEETRRWLRIIAAGR